MQTWCQSFWHPHREKTHRQTKWIGAQSIGGHSNQGNFDRRKDYQKSVIEKVSYPNRPAREDGTAREWGKVRKRDIAHMMVVIHSFACGKHQRTGNGNFSKCKYALVKKYSGLMHTTCGLLASLALFWQEEILRKHKWGRKRCGDLEMLWTHSDKAGLYFTLSLFHEHHLGLREEVEASEKHHLASSGGVTVHALLLHQGKLLSWALSYRQRHAHT